MQFGFIPFLYLLNRFHFRNEIKNAFDQRIFFDKYKLSISFVYYITVFFKSELNYAPSMQKECRTKEVFSKRQDDESRMGIVSKVIVLRFL